MLSLQEESFHLVDNRPVKGKQFGGRGRFQQNRFQQQKQREREAVGKGLDEKKTNKNQQQGQKGRPWQQYGRNDNRVGRRAGGWGAGWVDVGTGVAAVWPRQKTGECG